MDLPDLHFCDNLVAVIQVTSNKYKEFQPNLENIATYSTFQSHQTELTAAIYSQSPEWANQHDALVTDLANAAGDLQLRYDRILLAKNSTSANTMEVENSQLSPLAVPFQPIATHPVNTSTAGQRSSTDQILSVKSQPMQQRLQMMTIRKLSTNII